MFCFCLVVCLKKAMIAYTFTPSASGSETSLGCSLARKPLPEQIDGAEELPRRWISDLHSHLHTCEYAPTYTHMCMCSYALMCIHTSMYPCMRAHICTSINVHTCTHKEMSICICIQVHVRSCRYGGTLQRSPCSSIE